MQTPLVIHFDSISGLRNYASLPTTENEKNHEWINSDEIAKAAGDCLENWFGVENFQKVEEILNGGWPEGVERMNAAMHEIDAPDPSTKIKRRKTRGDSGDEFDWQAYAQGEADIAWTRPVPKKIKNPRKITLFCDLTLGSTHETSSDQFFWRGAAALYLTDALSKSGYNVEIIASSRLVLNVPHRPDYQFNILVKNSDMPINQSVLASTLCLAAFVRVVIFSATCAIDCHELGQGFNQAMPAIPDECYFPIIAYDKESARSLVINTMKKISSANSM